MSSNHFMNLMEELKDLHAKKNHDYSQKDNPFSNFERASELASWFSNEDDKVFATMLGIKLARLAELRNGKTPNNESIDDSFKDLTCYAGLWTAFVRHAAEEVVYYRAKDESKFKGSGFICNHCKKEIHGTPPFMSNSGNYFCTRQHLEEFDGRDLI